MSEEKPVKLDEPYYCKVCEMEIKDDKSLEYHRDIHGHTKVIPLAEINFVKQKKSIERIEESKQVLDFVMSRIKKTVVNQNNSNEVFIIVELNGHIEAMSLSSQRAIDWLFYEFTKSVDSTKLHGKEFFKTILQYLISKARIEKTPKEKIYNRIAQLENEIWYDLGREDRKCVKITAKGVYGVILDENSPIFRRNKSLQEQIPPKEYDESKNALDELINLMKISQDDKLVFKINLICLFLEGYPMPIIAIGGTSGSFKTSMTSMVKMIVDPSGKFKFDNVSSLQQKADDLIIYLNNRYLGSFDNISFISKEQSDILCRTISGSSYSKRELYENSEETILTFMRKVILNGIVPNLDYEDLQTRLIFYNRETPDRKSRITEDELFKKFNELLPYALGEIFHILSQALSWYKSLKSEVELIGRMADFEVWGEIISRTLGNGKNNFLTAYSEKLIDTIIINEGAFPLATTLQSFMSDKDYFEASASDLFERLVGMAEALKIDWNGKFVKFPKASNKLIKALTECDYVLRNNGLFVKCNLYKKNDGKYKKKIMVIYITKSTIQEKLSSLSPLSPLEENQAQKTDKIGGDTSEDTKSIPTEASEHTSDDKNNVSSPKIDDSSHQNLSSEHSEDSGDTS